MNPPGKNTRWEEGKSHHPLAKAIFQLLKDSDWECGNDYFGWKKGGDGDNGETLMFALSEYLEQKPEALDALKALLDPPKTPPELINNCKACASLVASSTFCRDHGGQDGYWDALGDLIEQHPPRGPR